MDRLMRPHFRSTLALLGEFQGLKGLQLKHFRYALFSNHDNVDSWDIPTIEKQIPPKKLKELIERGEIVLDTIPSTIRLIDRINELVSLGVVIRDTRFRVNRYHLKTGYIYLTQKNIHIKLLGNTELGHCTTFPNDRIILYRMQFKDFQKMSEEQQNEIKKNIHLINQLITSIEGIYKTYLVEQNRVDKFQELGLTRQ